MNYSDKLRSPKWQKKRLEILNRDNFTCCHCGDTETELHVHHLKYTKEPWNAPNEDLQTLCKLCHTQEEELKKLGGYKIFVKYIDNVRFVGLEFSTGTVYFDTKIHRNHKEDIDILLDKIQGYE